MAAGLEPLVVFWSGRGIHITVLLSFTVQVMLLLLADFRRRTDWPVLKVIIWSAYMLADTTAIYALGHMSVVVRSQEHHLMALWAPLLLVHLGGQDNITAYAIEDNSLWLRHLQTFGVQVLAAGYVLYASSILSHPSLLRSAAILMSVVGVLKYGERVWALMGADSCASSSLSATSYKDFNVEQANYGDVSLRNEVKLKGLSTGPGSQSYEADLEGLSAGLASQSHEVELGVLPTDPASQRNELGQGVMSAGPPRQGDQFEGLVIAYSLLDVPKQMFEGPTRFVEIKTARRYEGKFMLEVVEKQLTMMYDLLYTKAAVMHTWYGLLVRVTSLPFTMAALMSLDALGDKDGYRRSDVLVTKVLLTGAVILETVSVLRALFSMWTAALLYEQKWYKLGRVVQLVELVFVIWPMMLLVRREGYWSGHMRQHDLFKVLAHTGHSTGSRIAKMMGREDMWDSTVYSWSTRVPGDIIDRVLELVSTTTEDGQTDITESRGRNALRRHSLSSGEDLAWSVGLDLDESILVWHIATHVYLRWYKDNTLPPIMLDLLEATEALCNYMFFLLAARPYMLPYPVTRQRYVQLCHDSITHLRCCIVYDLCGAILDQKEALMEGSPLQPDDERRIIGVSLSRETAQPSVNCTTEDRGTNEPLANYTTKDGGTTQPSINTTLDRGCQLAAKLLHTADGVDAAESGTDAASILKMIFEVWVEMLCYTAYWCNEKSHAKNLTNGGELMTIVAFMMVYMSNGFIKHKE